MTKGLCTFEIFNTKHVYLSRLVLIDLSQEGELFEVNASVLVQSAITCMRTNTRQD